MKNLAVVVLCLENFIKHASPRAVTIKYRTRFLLVLTFFFLCHTCIIRLYVYEIVCEFE